MNGKTSRIIAHVDMDSFFTAIEVHDDPALRGKPVIVGADPKNGRGRGVVSAASYEARRFGVHSAMPISQAYRLCPRGVFLLGRMNRYVELSDQVMAILRGFSPMIEQVSVDEAFLDLSGCRRLHGAPREMGIKIKGAVRDRTGLTASVGIGPNKLVAKIASDLRKPDGLVVVAPGEVTGLLENLPIRRLWGVGPKTEGELFKLGLRTIGQLAAVSPGLLERRFGESGRWLRDRANGRDDDPVCTGRKEKSLGREITFERDTGDRGLVMRTLLELCDDVAARLRRHGLRGRTITLKIRYQGFETHTFRSTVPSPTDNANEMYERANSLFERRDQPERKLRLIGVTVSNFDDRTGPDDLFERCDAARRKRRIVDITLDAIKAKFGQDAVVRAGTLDRTTAEQ